MFDVHVEYLEAGVSVSCTVWSLYLHILQMFTHIGNVTLGSLPEDEIKSCSVQNNVKRIINRSGRQ